MDYFTAMMDDVDLLFLWPCHMYQLMFPYWADVAKNQSGTADRKQICRKTYFALIKLSFRGH